MTFSPPPSPREHAQKPTNTQDKVQVKGLGKSLDDQQIRDILSILPHRYPFLLVDRVERIKASQSGVGIKAISVCEPWFQGHFPDRPIFPGVLILEAMAQVASIVFSASNTMSLRHSNVYFVGINRARFRKPVYPGCILELHVEKVRERTSNNSVLWRCQGEAKVAGEIVADGEIMAMMEKSSD